MKKNVTTCKCRIFQNFKILLKVPEIEQNSLNLMKVSEQCYFLYTILYKTNKLKIEDIQRRVNKYILNNYTDDYKSRLNSLHLLPLMMILEINDIMYFVNNLKTAQDHYNITNYIEINRNTKQTRLHNLL